MENLVLENMRLAEWRADHWAKKQTYIDVDELTSIGYYALVKASKKYNKEKSKFSTYATTCIDNAIKDELKKVSRIVNKSSSEEELKYIEDTSVDLDEFFKNEIIINAISKLDENSKNIIYLYYFKNYNLEKLAELYNISIATTSRKLKNIRNELRDYLKGTNYYENL